MKNITRTYTTTRATVKVYNEETDCIVTVKAELDGKFETAESFKKEYQKNFTLPVLKVLDMTEETTLYGMPEASFLALGKAFAERNKENRGMISKKITTTVYNVKVFDFDNETIIERTITGNTLKEAEKTIPANFKLLKVVSESKVETLVCMTPDEFKDNARPMIDHFHYKEK